MLREIFSKYFVTEDYSDITFSIEDLKDWNDLVLHPNEDEIGVSATEIPAFIGDNDKPSECGINDQRELVS